jgi:hypothetical protein
MSKNHGYEIGVLLGVSFGLSTDFMKKHKGGYYGHEERDESDFDSEFDAVAIERIGFDPEQAALDILADKGEMSLGNLSAYSQRYILPMSYEQRLEVLMRWQGQGLIEIRSKPVNYRGNPPIIVTYVGPERIDSGYKKHNRTPRQVVIDFLRRNKVFKLGKMAGDCSAIKKMTKEERGQLIQSLVDDKLIKITDEKLSRRTVKVINWIG